MKETDLFFLELQKRNDKIMTIKERKKRIRLFGLAIVATAMIIVIVFELTL